MANRTGVQTIYRGGEVKTMPRTPDMSVPPLVGDESILAMTGEIGVDPVADLSGPIVGVDPIADLSGPVGDTLNSEPLYA